MRSRRKIRVLVVDDSAVFREILSKGISSDPGIEVVATAKDAFDARDKIIKFIPDVMTCDVEMPKMNGIEFVRQLLPQYPLPVIMVSMVSGIVFDAISAGAVDFVAKPDMGSVNDVGSFIGELISKIKIAASAKVYLSKKNMGLRQVYRGKRIGKTNKIIAIGASTGGIEAVELVLGALPPNVPGIIIVQHIPSVFSRMFAERLNTSIHLNVKEAQNGDWVERGQVLIAPGDLHTRVKKTGESYRVECFEGEKISGHCPSVDVLFESVAKSAGKNAVGVILTGMGYDGAKGLLAMKCKGARTIGQDEKTSVVYGMPKVAFNIGAVEKQVSLDQIPQTIYDMLEED